jgi:NAD(P)-dependent dehydrogenase (short-subunit alcohol dehydrogenase family)
LLQPGSKVVIISSQAGSVEWRSVQNASKGGDYCHHMSRAACNMGAALLAQEFKSKNIPVGILHPGFNRTEMTKKYEAIWDKEGAVHPSEGVCVYVCCLILLLVLFLELEFVRSCMYSFEFMWRFKQTCLFCI